MISLNSSDIWSNISLDNNTAEAIIPPWKTTLLLFYKIVLMGILMLIMVAMGCNISLSEVKAHLKKPVGLVIGATSQFFILPLLAFGLAHALSLDKWEAIGTLLITTCPGGTVSNIFTFWSKGDVSLSVSMTTTSTILSFGMMPLNLWLYCRSWTSDKTVIPYVNIVITLASILGPVVVGLLIKWKSLKAAKIMTKIGSASGIIFIVIAITVSFILFPGLRNAKWQIYFVSIFIPMAGFILSYGVARILKRPPNICRTIGIETGCQNASMAIAIGAFSFSGDIASVVQLPALVYGPAMTIEGFIVCALYNIVMKYQNPKVHKNNDFNQVEMNSPINIVMENN